MSAVTASALVLADAALERGEVPTVAHEGSPVLIALADPAAQRYLMADNPNIVLWHERHQHTWWRIDRWRAFDWTMANYWSHLGDALAWLSRT